MRDAPAHISGMGQSKDVLRAMILVFFVFAYGSALVVQGAFIGVARETHWLAMTLVPATLLGITLGRGLTAKISERWFRKLILAVLLATVVGLLLSVFAG